MSIKQNKKSAFSADFLRFVVCSVEIFSAFATRFGEKRRDGHNGEIDRRNESVCRQRRHRAAKIRIYDFRHTEHKHLFVFLGFDFFRFKCAHKTALQIEGSYVFFFRFNFYFQRKEIKFVVFFTRFTARVNWGLISTLWLGSNFTRFIV